MPQRRHARAGSGGCLLAVLLLLLAGGSIAASQPGAALQGVVSKVHDGDSLWLAVPGQPTVVVRLRDIDAPELCQPWGEQARDALAAIALGQPATLQVSGRDAHGRTLGRVSVDGLDLGRHLVEQGHAWSIRSRWDQGPLVRQERMARALARGLHASQGAEFPWHFRKQHGPCPASNGTASTGSAKPRPSPAAQPAALPPEVGYRCDGRLYCSQMRSCAEARWFLANCPGVKMDGDGDGVPCEAQWCR